MISNELIYHVLCTCLNLDPESDEAAGLIIPAYQEPEVATRPSRERNVIYFSCDPVPGADLYDSMDVVAGNDGKRPRVTTLMTYRLLVVCYGPDALENALAIRAFLFLDGNGLPKSMLRKAGFYPVLEPGPPVVGREPEGMLWRKRADVAVVLRKMETEVYPEKQGMIERTAEPRIYVQY